MAMAASAVSRIAWQFSGRRSSSVGALSRRIRGQAVEEEGRGGGGDEDFEARLAKLQRKVTGKKAELRKARKAGEGAKAKKDSLFIPPVELKEPIAGGLVVEMGFTPYTERLNGRLAILGLAAVLLVELASGDSFIKFHDPGTLFVQAYTVLSLTVIYVKYEKERISVWPKA